jgi:hypothetical protein
MVRGEARSRMLRKLLSGCGLRITWKNQAQREAAQTRVDKALKPPKFTLRAGSSGNWWFIRISVWGD